MVKGKGKKKEKARPFFQRFAPAWRPPNSADGPTTCVSSIRPKKEGSRKRGSAPIRGCLFFTHLHQNWPLPTTAKSPLLALAHAERSELQISLSLFRDGVDAVQALRQVHGRGRTSRRRRRIAARFAFLTLTNFFRRPLHLFRRFFVPLAAALADGGRPPRPIFMTNAFATLSLSLFPTPTTCLCLRSWTEKSWGRSTCQGRRVRRSGPRGTPPSSSPQPLSFRLLLALWRKKKNVGRKRGRPFFLIWGAKEKKSSRALAFAVPLVRRRGLWGH